jgi:hypothetical protein
MHGERIAEYPLGAGSVSFQHGLGRVRRETFLQSAPDLLVETPALRRPAPGLLC